MDEMTQEEMVEIYENSNTLKGMVAKRKKELMDEKEEEKKKRFFLLVKFGSVAGLLGILVIFASIAWFTMNKEVGTSGMGVKTVGSLYELQTSGTTATYAYFLNDEALGYSSGTEVSPGVFRTGSTGKLSLMLASDDDPMNLGLQPGRRGSFSFTIVPNSEMAGDSNCQLQINYTISMKGYYLSASKKEAIMVYDEIIAEGGTPTAEQTSAAEITFNDLHLIDDLTAGEGDNDNYLVARNLMNGHLLFFDDYTNSKYSDLIDFSIPGEAKVDFGNTKTVTINWIWPETYADIVDNEDTVIAADYLDDVVDYIVDNENYFFYNLNKSKVTGLNEDELTSSAIVNENNYLPLSTGYNNADQCIGENVQFVLIEITTDGSVVAKE